MLYPIVYLTPFLIVRIGSVAGEAELAQYLATPCGSRCLWGSKLRYKIKPPELPSCMEHMQPLPPLIFTELPHPLPSTHKHMRQQMPPHTEVLALIWYTDLHCCLLRFGLAGNHHSNTAS